MDRIEGLDEGDRVKFQRGVGVDTEPAIVTKVWNRETGTVNLCVFQQDGTTRPETSVVHKSYGEKHGYASWWMFPERAN